MSKPVPISFALHGKKCLLPLTSYAFAANQHLVPLLPSEFSPAAHCFPIIFVQHHDKFSAFGLLGLKSGSNLMIDSQGHWQAAYVPAVFRSYPFSLARPDTTDRAKHILCIDASSDLLADVGGTPLFTAEGQVSPLLDKVLSFLTEYQKQVPFGEKFCEMLSEFNLLIPFPLVIKTVDKTINIEGLSQVDEQRFNQLPVEDFLALRTAGMLPLIYAHLFSLSRVSVLLDSIKSLAIANQAHAATPQGPGQFFEGLH